MKKHGDTFGLHLLGQFNGEAPKAETIERDDGHVDFGSDTGLYFSGYDEWSPYEQDVINTVTGRVLDIGCGAGRHSLYLEQRGLDVTAIDSSPGAIEVCRRRGLKNALVRPIADIDKFAPNAFDTVLMLGNNFGLFGDAENAGRLLKKLAVITSPGARIIAGTRDPYKTDSPEHLEYHAANRRSGRMPGQIRIRVIFGAAVGEWLDYLFVSPAEMQDIFKGTAWRIDRFIGSDDANYLAVISKA